MDQHEVVAATESAAKKKRSQKRKPIWVAIPASYETVKVVDGPEFKRASSYSIHKCYSKKEVGTVLSKAGIDASGSGDVIVLRAEPLPLKLSAQVTIKF
jgi:hypothetical protein